ncbi:MAG TPA: cation diffusion facilitator family transporter [Kineosporiaceae bacterium]|nr:cation diffusion facilitator family transporter [Kineosporiaceae bacterium]
MKRLSFPLVGAEPEGASPQLTKFAWLSIATALVTIALKTVAYLVTGSVGLLSDAAESGVNLVAAVVALVALTVAARPADHNHHYGHGKAEYFSAGSEGMMIFIAAGFILVTSVQRFLHPAALESIGLGLAISTIASVFNGVVGVFLVRSGRRHRSVTLEADGKHLLTDVWTSAGVIVGVLLVALTGWQRLDPIVAALVAVNILVTGSRLVSQSVTSLLDAALPAGDVARLTEVLDRLRTAQVDFADLRTRESGRHRFVSVTVLVPGDWTVERGHTVADDVEKAITLALPDTAVQTHLEPRQLDASGRRNPDGRPDGRLPSRSEGDVRDQ